MLYSLTSTKTQDFSYSHGKSIKKSPIDTLLFIVFIDIFSLPEYLIFIKSFSNLNSNII